jgi:hypothetical protein
VITAFLRLAHRERFISHHIEIDGRDWHKTFVGHP